MSVKNDRVVSLALSHARLHIAMDMTHWALSGLTDDVLDRKEVDEVRAKLKKMSDKCWEAMMKVSKGAS
jgi:hypothetical protein